jgi:hypothetical protein
MGFEVWFFELSAEENEDEITLHLSGNEGCTVENEEQ